MNLIQQLSLLALRQLVRGACRAAGVAFAAEAIDKVSDFLAQRFNDQSRRLTAALQNAGARAWKALEIALAGESFWNWLDGKEDKELRRQVRAFLDAVPAQKLPLERDLFRQRCLDELRAVRRNGHLGGTPNLPPLARQAAALARFAEPHQLLQAEWQIVQDMAGILAKHGQANLARFLSLEPLDGQPLLALAVRYFFRRAVEEDRKLFQGLAWASWENLAQAQERGFAFLQEALVHNGQELDRRLGELQAYLEQILGGVLDIRAEQRRHGDRLRDLYDAVLDVHRRLDEREPEHQPQEAGPGLDGAERRLVESLLARYRGLSPQQQRQLPALLHAIAQLQMRVGEVEQARETFATVETFLTDRRALAEAHYHAFQAALGRHDWTKALASYRQAADLDPACWTRERLDQEVDKVLHQVAPPERAKLQRAMAQWRGTP